MSEAGTTAPPLAGIKVIELASLAPGPFGCMVLADLGAKVVVVDRPTVRTLGATRDPMLRSRQSIVLDLKDHADVDVLLRLIDTADVLVECFRPGVAERLGFGPDVCLGRNSALIYARMTGWGQTGPLALRAGHDIDFIALAGALAAIGPPDRPPVPPLNYVGDFGGGGMLLVVGVLAALVERGRSGRGQVLDVAIVDGVALMTSPHHGMRAEGQWSDQRGQNLVDGGAPFYRCYATSDDRFMAVGAIEPAFYGALLVGLGLDAGDLPPQMDPANWPSVGARFAGIFAGRTQADWTQVFENLDACVVPVLGMDEALVHPHNIVRGTFMNIDGLDQPSPAPRFSRSTIEDPRPPEVPGANADDILAEAGFSISERQAFVGRHGSN